MAAACKRPEELIGTLSCQWLLVRSHMAGLIGVPVDNQ